VEEDASKSTTGGNDEKRGDGCFNATTEGNPVSAYEEYIRTCEIYTERGSAMNCDGGASVAEAIGGDERCGEKMGRNSSDDTAGDGDWEMGDEGFDATTRDDG
jgi:hypothetical protein